MFYVCPMKPLRLLLSQTLVYGLSSMLGRFLNYLLVPLYTRYFAPQEYGTVSEFYAYAGFFSVVLTLGMETAFFRFAAGRPDPSEALASALRPVLRISVLFFALVLLASPVLSGFMGYGAHPEYLVLFAAILALDAPASVLLAGLRQQDRAVRFATVRLCEIGINIGLNLLFFVALPLMHAGGLALWIPQPGLEGVFIANLAASLIRTIWLWVGCAVRPEAAVSGLTAEMRKYANPVIWIGLAGMVNEMLDRALLRYLLPFSAEENLAQLGIYAACYKLAMLMSLFTQAFRYAAEPFFFQQAGREDSKLLNGLVFRYFSLAGVLIFVGITLFLPLFSLFIGQEYREGLHVVPVLLLANLFLGMQVNLSVWYKLTDRTRQGAWIAAGGAAVTILLNVLLVPEIGYAGSAWATLICYAGMAAASYLMGRKVYPVDYHLGSVAGYVLGGLTIYALHHWLVEWRHEADWRLSLLLLAAFLVLCGFHENHDRKGLFRRRAAKH